VLIGAIGTLSGAMTTTGTTSKTYLTITEAATYCGVSTKTLRRAARSRRLAYCKPARAYLFAVADLDAYMDAARFGVIVFGAVN
jgi:excisionase family DNA binding protein